MPAPMMTTSAVSNSPCPYGSRSLALPYATVLFYDKLMAKHGDPSDESRPKLEGSFDMFARLAKGEKVKIERMPEPTIRTLVGMRDGTGLDTYVWLPPDADRVPAILCRTPYAEEVIGWARLGQMRYVEAGYALVYQMIRGTGRSQGEFSFSAPVERSDGYDSVEWIAAQPWCDGNVGMDGASYLAMMALAAAAAHPPHLRCIAPHVPSADFFREPPYFGGGFSRQHTLNWANLISVKSLDEFGGGFISILPLLANADWFRRIMMRPAIDAADDVLKGDKLAHYRDVLAHPTFDGWWRERTLSEADYAGLDLPILLVTGNFDLSVGPMTVWRGLEEQGPADGPRYLLVGPWDHSQSYVGSPGSYGPFDLGKEGRLDPHDVRFRFFEQHLKGVGEGPELGGRVKVFITGNNRWRSFSAYPPRETVPTEFFLQSAGRANTLYGDGTLCNEAPESSQSDSMAADPELPFVAVMSEAASLKLDLRELAQNSETLVYATRGLEAPNTVIGEPRLILHVSATTPDADIAAHLGELRSDGSIISLAKHLLRLRYRHGFDREVFLEPGQIVKVEIMLTPLAHEFAAGSRLVLLLHPGMFPFVDPNPNSAEPVGTATRLQKTKVSIFHDTTHPSRLILPVLDHPERRAA